MLVQFHKGCGGLLEALPGKRGFICETCGHHLRLLTAHKFIRQQEIDIPILLDYIKSHLMESESRPWEGE